MKLKWNGHACFTITNARGEKLIFDPFDESVGYGKLDEEAQIACVSHHHHDHDNVKDVRNCDRVFDTAGDFSFGDYKISACESFHDELAGAKRGKNLIFKVTCDGETLVHMGDIGHALDDKQRAFIRNADVLLIPVGGFYTIDTPLAFKIATASCAKCVIPMHYKNRFCDFPIETVERFARLSNAKYLDTDEADTKALTGTVVFEKI